jgi:hypothetical protein
MTVAVKSFRKPQWAELREAWPEEADFRNWLRDPLWLSLVSETIGIALASAEPESPVGSNYADLRCTVIADGTTALIELQLERTDDAHYGQLFCNSEVAAATVVVWIARKFAQRHVIALEAMNKKYGKSRFFFGLEVALSWELDPDILAPQFRLVAGPISASPKSLPTLRHLPGVEMNKLRLRYWTAFKIYAERQAIRLQRPHMPLHRIRTAIGRKGHVIEAIVYTPISSSQKPYISVQLMIRTPNAMAALADLRAMEEKITELIGLPLRWDGKERRKSARVAIRFDADFTNELEWGEQFAFLAKYLLIFKDVFAPLVHRTKLARASHSGAERPLTRGIAPEPT